MSVQRPHQSGCHAAKQCAAETWTLCSVQFHLRTLPAVLVYLAAGSMSVVFGGASVFLLALWWATAKRRGKFDHLVARPDSVQLSDDSDVDVDGASGALAALFGTCTACRPAIDISERCRVHCQVVFPVSRLSSPEHLVDFDECSGSVAGFRR